MRWGKGRCHGEGGWQFWGGSVGLGVRALILKILENSELHGYEIFSRLEELFPEIVFFKGFAFKGMGYRILRLMEEEGLITSRWETGVGGPARRVYRITEEGLKAKEEILKALEENLRFYEKMVKILKGGV